MSLNECSGNQIEGSNNNEGDCQTIEESINLVNEAIDNAIESNGLESAVQMLEPYAHKSLYHSAFRSILIILKAGLTLKKDDLEKASEVTEQTAKLSNKYRRTGFLNNLVKLFKTPNYDKYTDLEIHAELTYAKFLGMSAILCALEAQNIYALIKIAYRLRLCVSAFKECKTILRNRSIWESETSKQHFEAGVRLANGIQHLTISHIPPKLLKIVNFLGYKGVESRAFQELSRTAFELPGISSRIAQVVLLFYWIAGQPHACLGPKESSLAFSQQIIDKELKRFPKSLLYRLAQAKLAQISGHIDEAIHLFKDCLANNSLEISHKIFHMELSLCHALKCEWSEAIDYAELVRQQSVHSPAIITYLVAIFRYAKSVDDCDPHMKQTAAKLFEIIPSMRIRYFGKTITVEKISIENSLSYFKNNESLVLPELDSLYSGNLFYFIKNNETLLNKHLQRVDKHIDSYKKDFDANICADDYLTALFFRAVFLKLQGNLEEAKQCLHIILNAELRIEREFSIPPQTVLELGLIEMELNNKDEAKRLLNRVIKDYSAYLRENFVHLRVYAALRELGVSTDKETEDQIKMQEYGKEWLKDLEVEEKSYENIMKKDRLVLKLDCN